MPQHILCRVCILALADRSGCWRHRSGAAKRAAQTPCHAGTETVHQVNQKKILSLKLKGSNLCWTFGSCLGRWRCTPSWSGSCRGGCSTTWTSPSAKCTATTATTPSPGYVLPDRDSSAEVEPQSLVSESLGQKTPKKHARGSVSSIS